MHRIFYGKAGQEFMCQKQSRDQQGGYHAGHFLQTPNQEEVHEILFKGLEEALIFTKDFGHPDRYGKSNTAECKQSRRFLECFKDNF